MTIPKAEEAPMLRPREVGVRLSLHVDTVKTIPPAELPFVRINARGDRRYRVADVDAYLAARRVGS